MASSPDRYSPPQPTARSNSLFQRVATSRLIRSAVVTAVALSLVGGVAYATTRQTNPVYHGCYNKKTGSLRLVTRTVPRCTRNETAITWNQTGPQGPRGSQGPAGQTAAGASNTSGAQGPQGSPGPAGPIGPAGATGPQGPKGDTGSAGAAGPQGPQGPQGPAGPAGATGPQGPKGDTGAQGSQGPIGPSGPQGPIGPAGQQGPQGPAGLSNVQYGYYDQSIPAGCSYSLTSTCGIAAVECPTGTVILSGGYIVDSPSLVAMASAPGAGGGLNGWIAVAQNNDNVNAHTLEVWAVCANENSTQSLPGASSSIWHRESGAHVTPALLRQLLHLS